MRNLTCGICGREHYSGTMYCKSCSNELYGQGHRNRMKNQRNRIDFFGF